MYVIVLILRFVNTFIHFLSIDIITIPWHRSAFDIITRKICVDRPAAGQRIPHPDVMRTR